MMPTNIESELREAFAGSAAQVPEQIGERLRAKSYRPRTHGRVVVPGIAASVLLIGAGTAIVSLSSGDVTPAQQRSVVAAPVLTTTTTAKPATAKVVHLSALALVAKAMEDVKGDIFHVTTTGVGGYVDEVWITADSNTQLSTVHNPGGALGENMSVKNTGTRQHTVDIDYAKHTYWTLTGTVPTAPANCVKPSCLDAANGGIMPGSNLEGAPLTAEGVDWLISHGAKVSADTPAPTGDYALVYRPGGAIVETLFIDKATSLPTKVTYTDGGKEAFSSAVDWAPPTDANLAKLTVSVPSGFRQIPAQGSYPTLEP